MVQRRAARYTLNRYGKTESVTNMLDELGWDTLETRRKKSRLVVFYKIQITLLETDLSTFLVPVHRPSILYAS